MKEGTNKTSGAVTPGARAHLLLLLINAPGWNVHLASCKRNLPARMLLLPLLTICKQRLERQMQSGLHL